jgi:hypothetical protein
MFPSHSRQQGAIASQLVADLADYEAGLRCLLQQRWDPELYRALSDQFDRMELLAAALPQLAGSWSELLISRVELTMALWTLRVPSRVNGRVEALHALHCSHVGAVLRDCVEYMVRPPQAAAASAEAPPPADPPA